MDLNCLTVARARLMFAEFLVWFALPALSSAPHFEGHHFSVNGASLTGPLSACAMTRPANPASKPTVVTVDSFMMSPFPAVLLRRPNHPLSAPYLAHSLVDELLQPLPLVRLGGVEVAFRIRGDAVNAEELSRLAAAVAEVGDLFQRLAQDDAHLLVAAVGHEEVALLRVARERDVPDRALGKAAPRVPLLFHELAVLGEHLQPVGLAIADVDEAVVGNVGAVHRVPELL